MPTASTRPDIVTVAYTGEATITNQHIVAREPNPITGDPGDSDALKFSAADARILGECSATGGTENACDTNNNSEVKVLGQLTLVGGDQASLLVKGGSTFVTQDSGVVLIRPSSKSKTDILVDDWSDQSTKASVVSGTIRRVDGKPVRIVFGRRHRPKIDGPTKVMWLWTIGLHFYNPIKALIRRVLRIPPGVKGPSWF